MRVIDMFDVGVLRFPDHNFVVEGDLHYTYREASRLSHKMANALNAAGIGERAKVATFTPNNIHGLIAHMGIIRAGATWVPINIRSTEAEIRDALDLVDCEFLLYHSKFSEIIAKIRNDFPAIRGWVCLDRAEEDAPFFLDWLDPHGEQAPLTSNDPQTPSALMLTSGTTGKPKGVILTNLMFETLANAWAAYFPYEERPINLCVAPLTHAAGAIALTLFYAGATNIIMPEFKPGEVLANIERYKVTTTFLPPTLIYVLLAHPDLKKYDYSSLRYLHYAASPMSVEKLKEAMAVFGPVLTQAYGQTEMPIAATLFTCKEHVEALSSPHLQHRLLSAGRPTHVSVIGIMDESGKLLGRNEIGEIVCRGNLPTPHYYKNPEATAELQAHGWHHTGDIGKIDDDGFVYILDRRKDMIITGGFNVYPNEVEQVLMAEPAIRECAVIGIPDEKWGEMVIAVVELHDGATLDPADVIARCKAKLGSVKTPKRIDIWESLPRNNNNKILKREIRDRFWEGRERKL